MIPSDISLLRATRRSLIKGELRPFHPFTSHRYLQSGAIGITAYIRARVPILRSASSAGTLAVTDVCLSMHAGLDPTWFGTSVIYNHLRSFVCLALLAVTYKRTPQTPIPSKQSLKRHFFFFSFSHKKNHNSSPKFVRNRRFFIDLHVRFFMSSILNIYKKNNK